jgi:Type IIA topoisomerase (DNA gyrase/topo II, topoisomerase IV), B subunit
VESYRDGQSSFAHFSRGILLDSGQRDTTEKNGTLIRFTPDDQMFEGYSFHMDIVETMVKNYSYLKKGLTLVLNGVPYKSENGLLDLVTENMAEKPLYPLIHIEGPDIEIVLTHGSSYGENISSFVNGQNTRDGGTHLAAYREAIAKTFKDFFKKDYKPEDVRQGVVGAIAIQIQEPIFEGQTKTKLGSTYMWETQVKNKDGSTSTDRGPTIRSFINDFVSKNLDNYLHMHLDIVPVIEKKIKESRPNARKSPASRRRPASATRRPMSITANSATAVSISTINR